MSFWTWAVGLITIGAMFKLGDSIALLWHASRNPVLDDEADEVWRTPQAIYRGHKRIS